MKYMISWFERPQGSPTEYENAQKRILEVFTQWKAPANFKDRVVRGASGRVGWACVGRLRRSAGRSQILFDLACFRIPDTTRDCRRGRCPRRTLGYCLARWTETQVIVAIAFGFGQTAG